MVGGWVAAAGTGWLVALPITLLQESIVDDGGDKKVSELMMIVVVSRRRRKRFLQPVFSDTRQQQQQQQQNLVWGYLFDIVTPREKEGIPNNNKNEEKP